MPSTPPRCQCGDNGINHGTNFNFEDALREAELSPSPRETFQGAITGSLSHLPPLKLSSEKSDAVLTLAKASNPGTSTRQEPVHSNEVRAQKRKKRGPKMRLTRVTSFQKVRAETEIRLHESLA